MTTPQDDAFAADIRRDLERVDQVMTHVIADPSTRDDFVRDPVGVLARLGLFPRMTPETRDRNNRIFYAVLQNTDLVRYLQDTFASFRAENEDLLVRDAEIMQRGLGQGVIAHSPDLDMAAADHIFRDPDTMRELYRLTLRDLNNRRLLHHVYTAEELDTYISDVVESIQQRRPPIFGPPPLDGAGTTIRKEAQAGVEGGAEVGTGAAVATQVNVVAGTNVFVATVTSGIAAVEVFLFATALIPVAGPEFAARDDVIDAAALGDSEAIRALATAGALLNLAGEMLVHANNFERG